MAAVIILGTLALLIGYVVLGEARRAEIRSGSWSTALLFPACMVLIFVMALVGQMLGRGAAIGVLLLVMAVPLLVAVRRRRLIPDLPEPPAPAVEELPERYRFSDFGGSLAGWGIPLVILIVGGVAFDGPVGAGITLGLAAVSAAVGLTIVFRRRRRRQREIIEEVERRASSMPEEELSRLVHLLETEHGRFEMRRLRRLVA